MVEARCALALDARSVPLKRLVRELEGEEVLRSHELALLTAAQAAASGDSQQAAALEAQMALPAGAAGGLADVVACVQAARALTQPAAPAPADAAAAAHFRAALPRLRALLQAEACHRDAFAACRGAQALLGAYGEDNVGVLSALLDALPSAHRAPQALADATQAHDGAHAQLLVRAVRDRRVGVITLALDVCAAAAPVTAASCLRAALLGGDTGLCLVLMCVKAPPGVAQRAGAVLAACASADGAAFARAMAPHAAQLADAIARLVTPAVKDSAWGRDSAGCVANEGAATAALAVAHVACRAPAARAALSRSRALSAALLSLLRCDCGGLGETHRTDYVSGASLIMRAWSRARPATLARIEAATLMAATLAEAPDSTLPSSWDQDHEDAWLLLLPLLHVQQQPLRASALRLADACAAAEPRCGWALSELGLAEPLCAALLLPPASETQRASAACAAKLLRRCCGLDALQEEVMRESAGGLEEPGALGAQEERRGVRALCAALLCSRGACDDAVAAAAEALRACCERHAAAQRYLACVRPRFACDLVRVWYERQRAPFARDAVEALLMALVATEEGALALARDAESEERVVAFVQHLRSRRAADMAAATGGASMLHPEQLGMATPYAKRSEEEAALLIEGAPAAAMLQAVDAAPLARYMCSLLPRGASSSSSCFPPCVVCDAAAGDGSLALRLAPLMPQGCTLYAASRCRASVDALASRAQGLVTPVLCAAALDALPLPANIVLIALAAAWLTEDACAMMGVSSKLACGGKLVLVEEDPNALAILRDQALHAGLRLYATPEVLNEHFVCVMEAP